MESFFASLKKDWFTARVCHREHAKAGRFEYIEVSYKRVRTPLLTGVSCPRPSS